MKIVGFVFASGKGLRLRPYTNETPKPLLRVYPNGESMLDLIIKQFFQWNVGKVMINYSYAKDKFQILLNKYSEYFKMDIELIDDENIAGQGGVLIKSLSKMAGYDVVLCINGDTYLDFDSKDFFYNIGTETVRFLSDGSFEKARPHLLLGANGYLIGYQSPVTDELYFYRSVKDTTEYKKINYLGLIIIPVRHLQSLTYDGTFLGLYGKDDLIERLYNIGVFAYPLTNVKINHFLSFDTCEEYEELIAKNGLKESVLHTKNI